MASQDEETEVRAPGLAVDFLDVSKEYIVNGKPLKALSSITLNVKEGEVAAIVGPSGAGMTTVLKIIVGLEIPSKGIASVLGLDVNASIEHSIFAFSFVNIDFNCKF